MTFSFHSLVQQALIEDQIESDVTAKATIAKHQQAKATIVAKEAGVISAVDVASAVFDRFQNIQYTWHVAAAESVVAGQCLCTLTGSLRELLAAERTALNFLQHLSGIASVTQTLVALVSTTSCQIVDTRKTTPSLRHLEKQAVLDGGGYNHRIDLASGMLIKENHIMGAGSVQKAITACQNYHAEVWVEVECETLAQVEEAVPCNPDMILLDNMAVDQVRVARKLVSQDIILEVSGNISHATALAYAQTGVDRLAVGFITHSAPSLDLSMRVQSL
ncbi:MAG: carboxylating nicotinate-nucleotide diphosphorylase [Mariprofundaceae bacterium]|nr:carboxylating nicotinate-nucleotide diphosphorylase [Mariprofundaceae bacterium]